MKILAIESAGQVASVALTDDSRVIAEYTTDYKKTHSETLMPMIDEICRTTGMDPADIDAIAVSKGPGSFTGLRIGAATAKGLALALGKEIIPVSTLAAMAYNFVGYEHLIVPIMDARRDQVYTGIYAFKQEYQKVFCTSCGTIAKEDLNVQAGINQFRFRLQNLMDDAPVSIASLVERLNAIGEDVIFLGDGVPAFREAIEGLAVFPFTFAPANLNRQRASAMAVLAADYYKEGKAIDGRLFVPEYFRPSQAERVRDEKLTQDQS